MTEFYKKVALYYRKTDRGDAMEDNRIIELFWERSESALSAVSEKYGRYCTAVARNMIGNEQAAEECFNDTLMELWEAIPPNRPERLLAFISEITRNNALNAIKGNKAQKRGGGEFSAVLDELYDVASDYSVERIAEQREIMEAVNSFLERLPERKQTVFVLRYWHCCSVSDIAQIVGMTEANVYNILKRVRKKLLEHLKKEGELI